MGRLTRRAENDETKAVYLYENTIDDTNCFLEGEYGYKAFDKLAAYEDIIDDPEKLKLIDELYLERCEEINRLKAENAELHCEMQAINALLDERDKEIKNNAIDDFVKMAMQQFTEFETKHGYPTVVDCKIILRDVCERMKEVQE